MLRDRHKRELVPIYAKTAQNANTDLTEIAPLSKGFTGGDVADVNLNGREPTGGDRVTESEARVAIGAGVDDDTRGPAHRLMDHIDEGALVVTLSATKLEL
jgi:hypothetical protein